MRFVWIIALTLAGCTTAQQGQDKPIYGRADCKTMRGNAALTRQGEVDLEVCKARAAAAGVVGTANMPVGYGLADAMASGLARGITQAQIEQTSGHACLVEHGYLLKTNAEWQQFCER